MDILIKLMNATPNSLKEILQPIRCKIIRNKYTAELLFWKTRFQLNGGNFQNSHYERIMLAMAEEPNDIFLTGKTVADFGCGPRGSLVWAMSAAIRIGIDVLADRYVDEFRPCILNHGMIYLKSTEITIPLPSNSVDILFTLNAMDHVDNFSAMCFEILRIIKPGGDFIGSFNLEEPPTITEPQVVNEELVKKNLLNYLIIDSYRVTNYEPKDRYAPFFRGELSYTTGELGTLWVRATKPQ